ncbi:MAG: spore photoproduct lyase [Oscillospiraceae bacterium]|jgi:spore photoproduct lyase|nr:spore photoproduct lyase [Oscillospiraceae bacterium]
MFVPKQALFDKRALNYPLGVHIYDQIKSKENIKIIETSGNKIKSIIENGDGENFYKKGKQTLVVGIKTKGEFQTCKPSAHYQLPLVSGCMGQCEYCYLHTQLGTRPYVKVNVNIDEILGQAEKYMASRPNDITIFEGAATSDPLCVERYTQALETSIRFFADHPNGRFRFVTKYNNVEELLNIDHRNHTEIRFSINTDKIIKAYEHHTASLSQRLKAAGKVIAAGYPVGFLIAPVFVYDGWQQEYEQLISNLKDSVSTNPSHLFFFEIITHRYTPRAKSIITEIFPNTTLPMSDEERQYKYGQFGYGKFVYPKENMNDIKSFFQEKIPFYFPESEIKYIV